MGSLRKVFISHSHKDSSLASALRDVLKGIFAEVDVAFSSDKEAGGGPVSGTNWLEWIHKQMLECDEALLVLTPYSVQKPWPMWEAGAVGGIALAQSSEAAPKAQAARGKPVTPIRFNVPDDALPGPFVITQAVDGTRSESLRKLLGDLMRRHDFQSYAQSVVDAVLNAQVPVLHSKVQAWLRSSPGVVSEGTIAEWCTRLDNLRDSKRSRDVAYLHRWIHLMYEGPESGGSDARAWLAAASAATWDIRLHLRLGENYEIASEPRRAIEQYELAAKLAPLDVFVLHALAKSYLDTKDDEGARRTINRILELDPDALRWNAEVAGLEGRYWKDRGKAADAEGRPERARDCYVKSRDAYQAAMEIEGRHASYYLADNVGQMSLKLGDAEGARRAYEVASVALEGVTADNENIWSLATRVTTSIVLGRREEALEYLARIHDLQPSEPERKSILGGLDLVRAALKVPDATYQSWLLALRSGERPESRAGISPALVVETSSGDAVYAGGST